MRRKKGIRVKPPIVYCQNDPWVGGGIVYYGNSTFGCLRLWTKGGMRRVRVADSPHLKEAVAFGGFYGFTPYGFYRAQIEKCIPLSRPASLNVNMEGYGLENALNVAWGRGGENSGAAKI